MLFKNCCAYRDQVIRHKNTNNNIQLIGPRDIKLKPRNRKNFQQQVCNNCQEKSCVRSIYFRTKNGIG